MKAASVEEVACPYCGSASFAPWAREAGFSAVRCNACDLLLCNPRPALALIDSAVRTGTHAPELGGHVVTARRVPAKVRRYKRVFSVLFDDMWASRQQVSWLDVGAGYGEILEAVRMLAPAGSQVVGLEPMHHKAVRARERGLEIIEDYLRPGMPRFRVISIVDVFSHIPDFGAFLLDLRQALVPEGELFLETGNLADLARRDEFPYELGLPDHLVFAGEKHILGFLDRAGFDIVAVRRSRIDGVLNLAKNVAKKLIGRPAAFGWPYTSKYRQVQIRARLRPASH